MLLDERNLGLHGELYVGERRTIAAVAREEEGDTIYAVDRVSEELLVEFFEREVARESPLVLIGEGSIVGILIGAALLQVLQNLVNLLGIPSSLNFAVLGVVILFGVLADQIFQRRQARVRVKLA